MRIITATASLALLALPLVATVPARADNDFLNQAQRLLNNGSGNDRDRDAYERGREDELRRQRADRDRRDLHREHDAEWSSRNDRARDSRYGSDYR
jgi:hypothetical protein